MQEASFRGRTIGVKIAAILASGLLLFTAACSSGGDAIEGAPGGGNAAEYTEMRPGDPNPTDADTEVLNALPASVKEYYNGFWNSTRIGPNPYADYEAPEAPWKVCYADSFQGNTWRIEGMEVAKLLVADLAEQGLAEPEMTVTNANNDATLMANQVNSLVQQGCHLILAMQPPSIGVCQAFDQALAEGVLTVVMQSGTECTSVIHSDFGAYAAAKVTADWLVEQVKASGSTGNIVMCNGIPGVATAEARQLAARVAFEDAGLTVDEITGEWDSAVIKSQMVNYLSTHPGEIAGVWDGGVCNVPVNEALAQAGRDSVPVTGFEGPCNAMAQWSASGNESISLSAGAGQGVVEAVKVGVRMLSGQKPTVNTLLYPPQVIDKSNFEEYYDPAMTLNSVCSTQPVGGESVPNSYYDDLFEGGEDAPTLAPVLTTLPVE